MRNRLFKWDKYYIEKYGEVKTEVYTAGEALSKDDALYYNTTDDKVYKADSATVLGSVDYLFVGFATADSAQDAELEVQYEGEYLLTVNGGVGSLIYLDATAGQVTTTEPDGDSLVVGVKSASDKITIFSQSAKNTKDVAVKNYLMKGYDGNLSKTVFWKADEADLDGSEYSTPANLNTDTIEVVQRFIVSKSQGGPRLSNVVLSPFYRKRYTSTAPSVEDGANQVNGVYNTTIVV